MARAEDVAHSLRKTRPLLSQLALFLKLPQTNLLMHIRKFQKQPQLLLPMPSLKGMPPLADAENLLRVLLIQILVPINLQATSSLDHTAPELRKMIVMTLLPTAKRPPDCSQQDSKKQVEEDHPPTPDICSGTPDLIVASARPGTT